MYLVNLSNEQKELFLDLSILSMESKGEVDKREKMLLEQYCDEMKIKYRVQKNINSYKIVLKRLKEISTNQELKKITVEILALIYVDEDFAEEEHELLMSLQRVFGFSSHLLEEIVFTTRHLILSYKMMENIVK